jgi:hypothetical protein
MDWYRRLVQEAATADTATLLHLSVIYGELIGTLSRREQEELFQAIQDTRREMGECSEK